MSKVLLGSIDYELRLLDWKAGGKAGNNRRRIRPE